jgi:hypothetical protein
VFKEDARMKKKIALVAAAIAIAGAATSSAIAAPPADNTRPGWGNGDVNHIHTGPPGQSVDPDIQNIWWIIWQWLLNFFRHWF